MIKYVDVVVNGKPRRVREDELMHWKYIKKERVNGKWRYYYADREYETAVSNVNNARRTYVLSTVRAQEAQANTKRVKDSANSDGEVTSTEQHAINEAVRSEQMAFAKFTDAGRRFVEADEKYKHVAMKTLPRRTIAKAASAVANLFSRMFGR